MLQLKSNSNENHRPALALFWMSLSGLGFATMSVFVKNSAPFISGFRLVFFRSFINLLFFAPFVFFAHGSKPKIQHKILILRGLFGFAGISCLFYAVQNLPLSLATFLNWCSPLFVVIFGWLILGERLSRRQILLIITIVFGLLLMISSKWPNSQINHFALWIGLLGACSAALAYVAVRRATQTYSPELIVTYFMLVSSALSLPLALYEGVNALTPMQWANVILISLSASFGQWGMTRAYKYTYAGVVSAMGLIGAVLTATYGVVFLDENWTFFQGLGTLIMVLGILLLARSNPYNLKDDKSKKI